MPFSFQQPFVAANVEPSTFPAPPTLADYHVRITEAEAKPNNDKTGGYLELTLEILDPGPFAGRNVPYRLNLFHATESVQKMAYAQLSAVLHVLQLQNQPVTDARQMFGIPFIAQIGPQANNPTYPNVFQVKDLNGVVPGQKTAAPALATPPVYGQPAAQAPPANAAPPGWAPAAAPPAAAPPVQQGWAPPGQQPAAPPAFQAPPAAAPVYAPPAAAPVYSAPPAAGWQPGAQQPGAKAPWEK